MKLIKYEQLICEFVRVKLAHIHSISTNKIHWNKKPFENTALRKKSSETAD